jgi:drug/metabolite transporter (DMT)-like permease
MASPLSTPKPPSVVTGLITVVLTLAGWSSVPIFLRYFSDHIDLWTSNGWRYGFSALLWLPVLIVAAFRHRLPSGLWRAALVPSVVNAAGQVLFAYAHYKIDPALLTFGLRSQLIFVAIGAWLMFPDERAVIRTPGFLLGAGLLVMGMVGVIAADDTAPNTVAHMAGSHRDGGEASRVQGIIMAIGSGLLFAAYGLAVRRFMAGINSVLAFAAICQFTAIVMVILMFTAGDAWGTTVLRMPGHLIFWLLVSGVIGIAIGHVFYYISIARLGVAVTAGVLQLQPFLVAIGSLWWFGERLTWVQWAGGCVAVVGALVMLGVQWLITRRAGNRRKIEEPLAIAEGESGA